MIVPLLTLQDLGRVVKLAKYNTLKKEFKCLRFNPFPEKIKATDGININYLPVISR